MAGTVAEVGGRMKKYRLTLQKTWVARSSGGRNGYGATPAIAHANALMRNSEKVVQQRRVADLAAKVETLRRNMRAFEASVAARFQTELDGWRHQCGISDRNARESNARLFDVRDKMIAAREKIQKEARGLSRTAKTAIQAAESETDAAAVLERWRYWLNVYVGADPFPTITELLRQMPESRDGA